MKKELNLIDYFENIKKVFSCSEKLLLKKKEAIAVDGEIIGTGRSDYTQDVTGFTLKYKGKEFILYDVPGIEGNESAYEKIIHKAINKAHLVFYVNSDNKKVEPKTAAKIKKYLRNDTDVYSIINVHLPPKAKRCIDVDGTYKDELMNAYQKDEKSIKPQTEATLKEVLGKNFQSGVLVNGLEAFSSFAYDKDLALSSILPDTEDKNLHKNQEKFLNEYNNDIEQMKKDSNINFVTDIIDSHSENFQDFIIESNKKKLMARLNDTYEKMNLLKKNSLKLSGKFIDAYKEIQQTVSRVENNFVNFIRRGYIENAVQDAMNPILEKFYEHIERYEGKLDKDDYEIFFKQHEKEIGSSIQNNLKEGYESAITDFKSSVEEAQNRFGKDVANIMKYVSVDFPEMNTIGFDKIASQMKFSEKDFGNALLKIGSSALTGFFLGSAIPGLGNVIGTIAGVIVGVFFAVIDFFMGKEKRIAKAKSQAKACIDRIADDITSELEQNFQFDEYVKNVQNVSKNIQNLCDTEISKFEILEKSLNNLIKYIDTKKTKLKELDYGTL